jgi:haloalkane dehalogenase
MWQQRVPGAQGQPHAVTRGAGHFLQEDKGAEVATAIVAFIKATSAAATPGT